MRRIWDEKTEKWYFSVVDVCAILTESENPQTYWRILKKRLKDEGSETVTNCNGFKMPASDGKMRLTDVTDVEGLLRIIQSIPSPKAEPFKLWLAKVGYERMREIEDPELATKRMHDIYLAKGYSEEWIALRMRGIATRKTLTDEWKNRGIDTPSGYAILTAEISKAAFGMTPSEYKTLSLESQTGRPVSTGDNYKHLTEGSKRKSLKPKASATNRNSFFNV